MARDAVDERIRLERPETPGEGQVLFGRQGLVAKEDHQVLEEGAVDRGPVAVVQGPAQVDAGDLGPDGR